MKRFFTKIKNGFKSFAKYTKLAIGITLTIPPFLSTKVEFETRKPTEEPAITTDKEAR